MGDNMEFFSILVTLLLGVLINAIWEGLKFVYKKIKKPPQI